MKMPDDLKRLVDRGDLRIRYEFPNPAADELERMAAKFEQGAGSRAGIGYWVGMTEAAKMCRRRAKLLRHKRKRAENT